MGIRGFRGWFESQFPDALVTFPNGHANVRSNKNDGKNSKSNKNRASSTKAKLISEQFDHVLIDMNQLLHVCLRRSRSDDHALTLLMKELDGLLTQCIPTVSLVLALDGSPSAAKLATQRKRRYSNVQRAEMDEYYLSKLTNVSKKVLASKRRRTQSNLRTLALTPGTDLMHRAEQALLYWAWQRLTSRTSPLSLANGGKGVKIYISPSTVPGEGEVKLLDWIYQHHTRRRPDESIVLWGGDSDLVLEGLSLPLGSDITHNVFVLLPDGNHRYLSVSLWETTRALYHKMVGGDSESLARDGSREQLQNSASYSLADILPAVRTDLVLLLIMNGNDYLPKLRGSSGFNKLLSTYLRLQRELRQQESSLKLSLIDPNSLEFNLEFCIAFFEKLAAMEPKDLPMFNSVEGDSKWRSGDQTPLQQLHIFVESGFLPKPINFQILEDADDDYPSPLDVTADDEEENIEGGEGEYNDESETERTDKIFEEVDDDHYDNSKVEERYMLIRLTLGTMGADDFCVYETWHEQTRPLKLAKQKLARMALNDVLTFGVDDEDEEIDEDADDVETETSLGLPRVSSSGYDWEIRYAVEGKVDRYLFGLCWNLQTYQDGVCADYAYNYGKRLSPTASAIVEFFKEAFREGRKVGIQQLRENEFSPAMSPGLSCLAALPSRAKHYVPAPYGCLSDETVESIYASCVSPEDNSFDIIQFEKLCEEAIAGFGDLLNRDQMAIHKEKEHEGRRIFVNDHSWTVVSKSLKPLFHPFEPPEPFSERLSPLRRDNRMKVSRVAALQKPRSRSVWGSYIPEEGAHLQKRKGFLRNEIREFNYSNIPQLMHDGKSIDLVVFKSAYSQAQMSKKKQERQKAVIDIPKVDEKSQSVADKAKKIAHIDKTISPFSAASLTSEAVTRDGVTALACLKQLEDSGLVGAVAWDIKVADSHPNSTERIRLTVSRGGKQEGSMLLEDFSLEQERTATGPSRQAIKQNLSSLALSRISGPKVKWTELSYKDLKRLLKQNASEAS